MSKCSKSTAIAEMLCCSKACKQCMLCALYSSLPLLHTCCLRGTWQLQQRLCLCFDFFFSLRILQTLRSTDTQGTFFIMTLEKEKAELAFFVSMLCLFFFFFFPLQASSHKYSYMQSLVRDVTEVVRTFQVFSKNSVFITAFSELLQLQLS